MTSKATEFQDRGLEWKKHCSLPRDLYSRGSALEEKKKKVIGKTRELNARRKFLLLSFCDKQTKMGMVCKLIMVCHSNSTTGSFRQTALL